MQELETYYEIEHEGKWLFYLGLRDLESGIEELELVRLVRATCPVCKKERERIVLFTPVSTLPFYKIDPEALILVDIPGWKSNSGLSYSGSFIDPDKPQRFITTKGGLRIVRLPYGSAKQLAIPFHHDAIVSLASVKLDYILYSEDKDTHEDAIWKIKTLCWNCCAEEIVIKCTTNQGHLVIKKVDDPKTRAIYNKIVARGYNTRKVYNHEFNHFARAFVWDGSFVAFGDTTNKTVITSPDHDELVLDEGLYVAYHPAPLYD